jgi:ribosome-associated protein
MDYVDFIVHVFSAEKRAFYGLERLRKSATTISVADLDAEVRSRIDATRAKSPKKATPAVKKVPAKKTAAKKSAAVSAAKKAPAKTVKKASKASKK